jgi:hypothetical protein
MYGWKNDVTPRNAGFSKPNATHTPCHPPFPSGLLSYRLQGLKLGGLSSESAKEGMKEESVDYRLYACIFHLGSSPTRGHYTAACRVGPSDDDWYTAHFSALSPKTVDFNGNAVLNSKLLLCQRCIFLLDLQYTYL